MMEPPGPGNQELLFKHTCCVKGKSNVWLRRQASVQTFEWRVWEADCWFASMVKGQFTRFQLTHDGMEMNPMDA